MPNFRKVIVTTDPGWQFDVKVDHSSRPSTDWRALQPSPRHIYRAHCSSAGSDDGTIYPRTAQNGGVEYNWSFTPTVLWTGRFSVDRVHAPGISNNYPTSSSMLALRPILAANGLDRMSAVGVDDGFLSIFTQCCVDTHFAHTLFSYSSALQWVKGGHSIKFGGEQRIFFNNFWQPDNPTGIFNFSRDVTTTTATMQDLGKPQSGEPVRHDPDWVCP